MKLVSVIIPTYNCASYVVTAIKSVLFQSYEKSEIIIIDDGSTDETREVIRPYMKDIVYIYQENRGLPAARNRGLQEATGEFIAFLDADDLWLKDKLAIQLQVFESSPSVGIVFSDFSVFAEDGFREDHYFKKCFPIFKENNITLSDIFKNKRKIRCENTQNEVQIYYGNIANHLFFGNFILPSSVVMRKSIINNLGGFDENYKIAEETDFFLRVCTLYDAAYVDRTLVDYLVKRVGNLTGSPNTEKLIRNAIAIQKKYLAEHPDIYCSKKSFFDNGVAKSYARLAYYYLTMKNNKDARKEAKFSIFLYPKQLKAYSYWLLSFSPLILLNIAGNMKRYIK